MRGKHFFFWLEGRIFGIQRRTFIATTIIDVIILANGPVKRVGFFLHFLFQILTDDFQYFWIAQTKLSLWLGMFSIPGRHHTGMSLTIVVTKIFGMILAIYLRIQQSAKSMHEHPPFGLYAQSIRDRMQFVPIHIFCI